MTASLAGRTAIVTGGGTGIGAACADAPRRPTAWNVTICGRREPLLAEVADRIAGRRRRRHRPHAGHRRHRRGRRRRPRGRPRRGLRPARRLRRQRRRRWRHGPVPPAGHRRVHSGAAPQRARHHALGEVRRPPPRGRRRRLVRRHVVDRRPRAPPVVRRLLRRQGRHRGDDAQRRQRVRPGQGALQRRRARASSRTEIMEGIPRDSACTTATSRTPRWPTWASPRTSPTCARFLLSDDARWVTGITIDVDGGHHLRAGPDFTSFIEPAIGADALVAKAPPLGS